MPKKTSSISQADYDEAQRLSLGILRRDFGRIPSLEAETIATDAVFKAFKKYPAPADARARLKEVRQRTRDDALSFLRKTENREQIAANARLDQVDQSVDLPDELRHRAEWVYSYEAVLVRAREILSKHLPHEQIAAQIADHLVGRDAPPSQAEVDLAIRNLAECMGTKKTGRPKATIHRDPATLEKDLIRLANRKLEELRWTPADLVREGIADAYRRSRARAHDAVATGALARGIRVAARALEEQDCGDPVFRDAARACIDAFYRHMKPAFPVGTPKSVPPNSDELLHQARRLASLLESRNPNLSDEDIERTLAWPTNFTELDGTCTLEFLVAALDRNPLQRREMPARLIASIWILLGKHPAPREEDLSGEGISAGAELSRLETMVCECQRRLGYRALRAAFAKRSETRLSVAFAPRSAPVSV